VVANDPWLNEGYDTPALFPGAQNEVDGSGMATSIDEDICRVITEKFNIPYDQIIASLKDGTYDDVAVRRY
jgi:hypothetical protein